MYFADRQFSETVKHWKAHEQNAAGTIVKFLTSNEKQVKEIPAECQVVRQVAEAAISQS